MLKNDQNIKIWRVVLEESGMKLQTFLKSKLGSSYSLRKIKSFLEKRLCEVNGRVERFSSKKIGHGDAVKLIQEDFIDSRSSSWEVDKRRIIFEDEHLLVYDKPSGISSDGTQGLEALLREHNCSLRLTHRLDRETSGLIILSKNDLVWNDLLDLFRKRLIVKEYLAVVDGVFTDSCGEIRNYLGKKHSYQGQCIWGEVSKKKGKLAITSWKREKSGKEITMLRCFPKTGRTHQIRVHLSGLGHPVLGDVQYGRFFLSQYKPQRILLHAERIHFQHPHTKKEIYLSSQLPDDFIHPFLA